MSALPPIGFWNGMKIRIYNSLSFLDSLNLFNPECKATRTLSPFWFSSSTNRDCVFTLYLYCDSYLNCRRTLLQTWQPDKITSLFKIIYKCYIIGVNTINAFNAARLNMTSPSSPSTHTKVAKLGNIFLSTTKLEAAFLSLIILKNAFIASWRRVVWLQLP